MWRIKCQDLIRQDRGERDQKQEEGLDPVMVKQSQGVVEELAEVVDLEIECQKVR
jgi:hypothetical protein